MFRNLTQKIRCGPGTVFKKGYTRKINGKYVKPMCIRSNAKKTRRQNKISCGPGEIARSGYVRQVSSRIQRNGYERKTKSGSVVRVYPNSKPIYVKPSCVKDTGKPGKLAEGNSRIGPLKKGELKRFGYSYKLSEAERRNALQTAIQQLGPLDVYRKLNAVAKLTERTSPTASSSFSSDRNWIRKTYAGANGSLQAF
jgi:hypothetical protein